MSAVADTIRKGVDTDKMFATLDLIKAQPELAKFQFRATNRWIGGACSAPTPGPIRPSTCCTRSPPA